MNDMVEHWDERRDGPLSESALRSRIEGRGYHVSVPRGAPHSAAVVGAEPVVSLDATRG